MTSNDATRKMRFAPRINFTEMKANNLLSLNNKKSFEDAATLPLWDICVGATWGAEKAIVN